MNKQWMEFYFDEDDGQDLIEEIKRVESEGWTIFNITQRPRGVYCWSIIAYKNDGKDYYDELIDYLNCFLHLELTSASVLKIVNFIRKLNLGKN